MNKYIKMSVAICILSIGLIFMGRGAVAEAGLTIVLDPGHDSTHSGASGNGIHEEEVNFKIAKYCKEELEKYGGISNIYMTRNSYECPYPGTTSVTDNKKRIEFAQSVGANLYVSLHNNSAKNTSAKGATVYYPNSNYKPGIGENGERFAKIALNKLVELGLDNRGVQIRNSEDNTRYPDGSLADYYGVIKNGKIAGFTAVIIEHAFISNTSDVSKYLSDDTKLKLLGIADAKAIVEFYGLNLRDSWNKDVSSAKLSTAFSSDNKKVTATVTGLSKAPGVKFAVWSSKNNQSDLHWYSAKKNSSGNWVYEIPLSDFKVSGNYNVHVYAQDSGNIFACSGTFTVTNATATDISIENIDFEKGIFDVKISDVTAKSGINNVRVAVWTRDDQGDKKWISASLISGKDYSARIKISDFLEPNGTFHIHAYATDNIGIVGFLKNTNYKLEYPQADVSVKIDENSNCFEVTTSAVSCESYASEVKVAVWSRENGQDDLTWYNMTKAESGYIYTGNLTEHITVEGIDVHVYAFLKNGTSFYLGSASVAPVSVSQSTEFAAENIDGLKVKWAGEKVSVIANENDFAIKLTGDSVHITEEAVKPTDESAHITEDAAKLTQDSAKITEDAAKLTQDSAKITEDAAEVTGEAAISKVSLSEAFKMRETNFAMKDSIELYRNVRSSLKADLPNKDYNFYITDVKMLYDKTKYVCEKSGKLQLQFSLPNQYFNKDIVIYKVDENGKIVKKYNNVITANGYAQIQAESDGTFVVAVVSDKVVVDKEYLYGDLNFDGKIDLNDAKLSLKGSLGIIKFTNEQNIVGDYNRDGKINLNDAKGILKKALGIK